MRAAAVVLPLSFNDADWDQIASRAPQPAATLRRYLVELERSAGPAGLAMAERTLRQLAGRITANDGRLRSVSGIQRSDLEDYITWMTSTKPGRTTTRSTVRGRLVLISKCCSHLAATGDPDAPMPSLIVAADFPPAPKPIRTPKVVPLKAKPRPKAKGPSRVPEKEVSWELVPRQATFARNEMARSASSSLWRFLQAM